MKKAAGITIMVALLGFNAYLWPTLIKEVKADQKNEKGVQTATILPASTPVMDLSNQGPRPAHVSAYPVEQPAGQPSSTALAASKPGTDSKKQSSAKAVQTASSKQPKKTAQKPSTPSRQSDGPDVQITYTLQPSTIHYEETTYTTTSSYGGGSFNMPLEYNPYTGKVQESVKIYRGMEVPATPPLNKQNFGIPQTVKPYVPPEKQDQQRLAPQSYPGR
ncbi:hypothetical protein [Brevibacillus centrosporus]|uniref:Uncharacterized protein n=1 Tax=Brevibacillus centrosporus TaxID=54910 RepID=A0A1I3SHZ0_9BACL|nr:hypothetical protein [Brevibacillus centrosporus]MED4909461.1 hypothetical protein [Brevibacillus centrosporus]SFJ58328.1 hypothetical protein SAMN05518846_104181 [Brevibacillus centrosporus]